jgi:hypothetical protein
MIRIKGPQNFFAGVLFLAFGAVGVWVARNYPFGTSVRMGPGYLPVVISWCMVGLGGLIMAQSLVVEGEGIARWKARPIILVLGGVLSYALTIERFGLVVATVITSMICSAANDSVRWIESVILAVGLTVFCILTFVYGLNLPLSIWPPQ